MGGQVVSPFDLSQTFLVGGGLLVSWSLPGPPVIKPLMQMVTMVHGQRSWQAMSMGSQRVGRD